VRAIGEKHGPSIRGVCVATTTGASTAGQIWLAMGSDTVGECERGENTNSC
jgi:hypothetical protein